jgi:tRNA G18 (ribose-2'-O)-methylase SpoU
LEGLIAPDGSATIVVAPQITSPDNLGSLLRLSAAFGVDAVVLGRGSADPFSRRALRVSMGAALAVPILEDRDPMQIVHELQSSQFCVVATVVTPDAVPLKLASRPARLALLFGNEAHGLPAAVVEASDLRVTIPVTESVDSLNVSAAAAVVLYHFTCVADTSV